MARAGASVSRVSFGARRASTRRSRSSPSGRRPPRPRRGRSAAGSTRSSSRSSSCATARTCSRSSRATAARTRRKVAAAVGRRRGSRREARRRSSPRPGSSRAPSRRSRSEPSTRCCSSATLLQHEQVWIGAGSPSHMAGLAPGRPAAARRGANGRSRRPSLQFRRPTDKGDSRASHREDLDERRARRLGRRARFTWACMGSTTAPACSRASAATTRPKGPAVFRLHRSHAAPARLGAPDRHGASRTRSTTSARRRNDLLGANGLTRVLHPPDRVLRLTASSASRRATTRSRR